MKLYHYADQAFPELKTRVAQDPSIVHTEDYKKAVARAKERYEPKSYYEHISFFFDPIPSDIIANAFQGHHHEFWYNGHDIYEHVVESEHIGKFLFQIVETPSDILAIDDFPDDGAPDSAYTLFFLNANKRKIKDREIGDEATFESAASRFVGKTRQAYIDSLYAKRDYEKRYNSDKPWRQYAAFVPHVMLYPEHQIIQLDRPVVKIKIGGHRPAMESLYRW